MQKSQNNACNANCSGRIQNGSEFFCGDGKVQVKSGASCPNGTTEGTSCKKVTDSYPGSGWSGTPSSFTSEACDPNETFDTAQKKRIALCNRSLGLSRTSYYTTGTLPSCSESCKISNAVKGTNCQWCGDGYFTNGENCGEGSDYNRYGATPTSTSGDTKERCADSFSVTNDYKYYINIAGVYCFISKGGDGMYGQSGNNGCSGATVASCYKLQKDDLITFKVGAKGSDRPWRGSGTCENFWGGGGGGASWVYLTRSGTNTLLMVAGGGGGGGWYGSSDKSGEQCRGGSKTNSADNNTSGSDSCTDNYASAGNTVNGDNFDDSATTGAGGDGGFHWKKKLIGSGCAHRYACGGGGGGYNGGGKGKRDRGGGGGSYVNTDFTSYDTSYATATMVAGSKDVSNPQDGSITVTNISAVKCSSCKWTSTYYSCD